MSINMSINSRVKNARNALSLTQAKFADQIVISHSYLRSMELGDRRVNDRIIRLIVNEFNVNEHWLKTGNGEMFKENTDISITKITNLFKALSPQLQTCAMEQMNALVEFERSLES